MPLNRTARTVILVLMGIFVLVPLIDLVLVALSKTWVYPNLLPEFSFDQIARYFDNGYINEPLKNSIILAILSTAISLILGILPAKLFATVEFRGKTLLYILLLLPVLTPGICIMFGMIRVMINLDLYMSYLGLLLAHVTFTLPYMIFMLIPVFKRYDAQMEDQSATLGVGKLETFFNVTLPAVKSGVAVGCLFSFIVSWSMYLITTVCMPRGYSTMATYLIPQMMGAAGANAYLAITILIFIIPTLIVLILTSTVFSSDDSYSRGGP